MSIDSYRDKILGNVSEKLSRYMELYVEMRMMERMKLMEHNDHIDLFIYNTLYDSALNERNRFRQTFPEIAEYWDNLYIPLVLDRIDVHIDDTKLIRIKEAFSDKKREITTKNLK